MATAKKTPIAYAVNPLSIALDAPILSLIDLGYQQGKTEDASDNQAKYAISSIDGFPEKIDDDSKAKLYKGYMMRYNDKHAPVTYGIVDGNYLLLDSLDKDMQDKVKEKVVIGVDVVYSYSQQEYGKLRSTDPAKYAVLKSWREPVNDFMSGCLGNLKSRARKIIKKQAGATERAPNLDFIDWIDRKETVDGKLETLGVLESMRVRCKTAKKRGDKTADPEKLDKAIVAFKAIWIG